MQVRGERLATAGIRSFADLLDFAPDLLRELAEHHTTLRRPNADSNAARWPLHPLWQALQADIAALPQTGLTRDLAGWEPGFDYRFWHQLRSLVGSLKGVTCTLAERDSPALPLDLPALLRRLPGLIEAGGHHQPAFWADDVRQALTRRGYGL